MINKARVSTDELVRLRSEVDILKTLDHPNIIRARCNGLQSAGCGELLLTHALACRAGFEGWYETPSKLYIVMELATGGQLLDVICARVCARRACMQWPGRLLTLPHQQGTFTEKDASEVMCALLQAVAYMHAKGVTHRDLKPGAQ